MIGTTLALALTFFGTPSRPILAAEDLWTDRSGNPPSGARSTISPAAIPIEGMPFGAPPQQGGTQGTYQGQALQQVEQRLGLYLNSEWMRAILTAGEPLEWNVTLKAGQVLVAEAMSDTFDPAIDVMDAKGKSMAGNDDRYPGDQRPLVLWRCAADGEYKLLVRSFKDRAGGQVMARFKTYDCLDLGSDGAGEGVVEATKSFMVRIPMKAGQLKDIRTEKQGQDNFIRYNFQTVIFPNGLPEYAPALSELLSPAFYALVAPLAGDYYLLYAPYGYRGGNGRVRIVARDIEAVTPKSEGSLRTAAAPSGRPALFKFDVKKGDFLEVSFPDLANGSHMKVSEAPDFSKFDISKPETNPFLPPVRDRPAAPEPAFDTFVSRARDSRTTVLRARRDATLWVASDGGGAGQNGFTMNVAPAAQEFVAGQDIKSELKLARTDYWWFDTKAGDVITFRTENQAFSQVLSLRDPDMIEFRKEMLPLDGTSDAWRMVVQKPGKYLLAVNCLGDGGAGGYLLNRTVLPAKEFGLSQPAKGAISDGEVQIWRFTAQPNTPIFVRWSSSAWSFGIDIYDENGRPTNFQRTAIGPNVTLGILNPKEPATYVIVLTGGKQQAEYFIDLSAIPAGGH